jgi:phage shock protein A
MNLLTRIKNYFSEEVEETNIDWKEVALDLNQSLIETQEKLQEANQEIADLKKIVAIYKEKENVK